MDNILVDNFEKKSVFDAFTVGLIGQIGSGKTTVRKIFSSLGVECIDADEISRLLYEKNSHVYDEIVGVFGIEILDNNKDINRKKLADIVFSNKEKLKSLEEITHKSINDKACEFLKSLSFDQIGLYESTKLIETKFYEQLDVIVYVKTDFEKRLKYLIENRELTVNEIIERNNMQKSDDDNLKIADFVIENNGTKVELEKKVIQVYEVINPIESRNINRNN